MRPAASIVLLALVLSPAGALAAQAASTIDRAAWLAGCWESRTERRTIQEMWMAPAGGFMLGGSRTVAGGVVREFEHLHIRAAGDTLIYTAIPARQQQTEFRAVAPSEGVVSFENPAHDFPQKITYRRITPDSLVARVEGGGRGFDIPMARARCGG